MNKVYLGNIQPNPKEYKIWVDDKGVIKTYNGSEWIENSAQGGSDSGASDDAEFVDLGLPSGMLWCTHNLGASKPEEPGLYYAFGDPTPYEVTTDNDGYAILKDSDGNLKHHYQIYYDSYKFASVDDNGQITHYKYNSSYKFGNPDFITELQPEDDIATQYNSSWRTPSYEDLLELLDNTTPSYDLDNKILKLTSNTNNNYITIPLYYDNCFIISKTLSDGSNDFESIPGQVWGLMKTYSNTITVADGISYGYNYKKNPYAIRPVKGGTNTKKTENVALYETDFNSDWNYMNVTEYSKLMAALTNTKPVYLRTYDGDIQCILKGNVNSSDKAAYLDIWHEGSVKTIKIDVDRKITLVNAD